MTAQSRDQQQEPSMEEILSSIRRIIADEEADETRADEDARAGAARDAPEALDEDADAQADEGEDEDVLELTRMVRESGEVVDIRSQEAASDGGAPEPAASEDEDALPADEEVELAPGEPEPEPAAREETLQEDRSDVPSHQAAAERLLSDATATAATGAFAKLSHAVQRTPADEAIADGSGRTVEQFIEDIIRPVLRDWMDENLPNIVERLVQKEIQKIARRAELIE